MKAVNIIGIILAVAIVPLCIYYVDETSAARWASWDFFNEYSTYYGPSAAEVTLEGAGLSAVLVSFFIFQSIINLVKIKTMTSKVLAIIGVSLMGIALLINLALMAEAGTYDEAGLINLVVGPISLAFSIVFLVQTIQFEKIGQKPQNTEVIDDIV